MKSLEFKLWQTSRSCLRHLLCSMTPTDSHLSFQNAPTCSAHVQEAVWRKPQLFRALFPISQACYLISHQLLITALASWYVAACCLHAALAIPVSFCERCRHSSEIHHHSEIRERCYQQELSARTLEDRGVWVGFSRASYDLFPVSSLGHEGRAGPIFLQLRHQARKSDWQKLLGKFQQVAFYERAKKIDHAAWS